MVWTVMGLAHGLSPDHWLGGLVSEPDMGAMLVYAFWVECAGLGVWFDALFLGGNIR